ncbi:MAG: glycosyl hydrolase family 39 [Mucilaginibacter sp.]
MLSAKLYALDKADTIKVKWDSQESVSKTTPTLQLVENPAVRQSPIHEATFKALKNLGADYVRYVPWFPYPKLAVAELKPPSDGKTYWDFKLIDSTMVALMEATQGHSVVVNFSTTPVWMWKTDKVVKYPENPYQVMWDYNQGTELRDTTMKELADYYARLMSWYTKGGFTDELGQFHKSGHFYKIPYWEVLNEVDFEHSLSPQLYTKMYDAIVAAMKKVSPDTKFIGLALAFEGSPRYLEYFLDAKNHKPGVAPEGISYHHYSLPSWREQPLDAYQYTFFEKADGFLDKVRYIEDIRKRLAPQTFTTINEIGTILGAETIPIPDDYWNLSGAMYAHMFLELTKIGIDVAGESQLVGYPTQFPDVSMINWKNANPNARYWVLKLLIENFGPGDKLVTTADIGNASMDCQAVITQKGKRILLINKMNKDVPIVLPAEAKGGTARSVDTSTRENPPVEVQLTDGTIMLKPFSVTVVMLK